MPIQNPNQLVDEFKKSGEFDRLRRELLAQFKSGNAMPAFMARIDDIVKQKLASDPKLASMSAEAAHAEMMQELERYPLVERAVSDHPTLNDPAFAASIRESVAGILKKDRSGSNSEGSESKAQPSNAAAPSSGPGAEDSTNTESPVLDKDADKSSPEKEMVDGSPEKVSTSNEKGDSPGTSRSMDLD